MPTFDASRLDPAMRARAIERATVTAVESANVDVDTLRDVRHRVEAALGWGAFPRADRKTVRGAVLGALRAREASPTDTTEEAGGD